MGQRLEQLRAGHWTELVVAVAGQGQDGVTSGIRHRLRTQPDLLRQLDDLRGIWLRLDARDQSGHALEPVGRHAAAPGGLRATGPGAADRPRVADLFLRSAFAHALLSELQRWYSAAT